MESFVFSTVLSPPPQPQCPRSSTYLPWWRWGWRRARRRARAAAGSTRERELWGRRECGHPPHAPWAARTMWGWPWTSSASPLGTWAGGSGLTSERGSRPPTASPGSHRWGVEIPRDLGNLVAPEGVGPGKPRAELIRSSAREESGRALGHCGADSQKRLWGLATPLLGQVTGWCTPAPRGAWTAAGIPRATANPTYGRERCTGVGSRNNSSHTHRSKTQRPGARGRTPRKAFFPRGPREAAGAASQWEHLQRGRSVTLLIRWTQRKSC